MKHLLLTLISVQLCATAQVAAQSGNSPANVPPSTSHGAAHSGNEASAPRGAVAGGNAARFGSVVQGASETPIRWGDLSQVELSAKALRLLRTGSSVRSEPLALTPLQLYRVSATMARGPGSTPRLAISYLDAQGKAVEWLPAWQHKAATHANWLPLSPRLQRYVQGFVLPLGATQPQLLLRLDAGDKALARYSHWTLSELRFEALPKVACCERTGDDRLLNGDFELGSREGLPKHWGQWGPTPDNRIELVELRDEPERKHVLRIKPGTAATLASSYLVPVVPGRAYRLSLWVRGQGHVELDVHSLSRDRPVPLRVGNHVRGAGSFEVQTSTWRELSSAWIAEAPNVALAHVIVAINAHSAVEIDAVELRPFE